MLVGGGARKRNRIKRNRSYGTAAMLPEAPWLRAPRTNPRPQVSECQTAYCKGFLSGPLGACTFLDYEPDFVNPYGRSNLGKPSNPKGGIYVYVVSWGPEVPESPKLSEGMAFGALLVQTLAVRGAQCVTPSPLSSTWDALVVFSQS